MTTGNDLTATLAWLVDIPSVVGEEAAICSAVVDRLTASTDVDLAERVADSVVIGLRKGRPLILVVGHLDTVPHQGQGPARVESGRLHGLGATDMKAGLAVMIHLLEDRLVGAGPYDLAGVFYSGEEGPAAGNQLEAVLASVPWLETADFAVVMEPSDRELQIGCNGLVNARVVFSGKSAHSARPWLGENAITKAGSWLSEMHERQPSPVEVGGLIYREVMSITRAEGGIANNIIPSAFTMNLNYRFNPGRTVEEAIAVLAEACVDADLFEVVDSAPAGPVRADHPFLQKLAMVSGAPLGPKQGWTDVATLGTHGIAAVNYGPGETALAHQVGESVDLSDLEIVFDHLSAVLRAN